MTAIHVNARMNRIRMRGDASHVSTPAPERSVNPGGIGELSPAVELPVNNPAPTTGDRERTPDWNCGASASSADGGAGASLV